MHRTSISKTALLIAGLATSGMAAFHFFLPHLFSWGRNAERLSPPIKWGLFSINVFFSCLLLLGGIATIIVALNYKERNLLTYCIFIGMGIFWIINVSYQIVFPFPVAIMKWILLAFAVTVAGHYWFAI